MRSYEKVNAAVEALKAAVAELLSDELVSQEDIEDSVAELDHDVYSALRGLYVSHNILT